ncbi:MAG: NADH-quinone oxidoreductase subunit M, partial [Elusimicrobia bacterium]|nr:NADH-quinone oxidoreductase subunit M [Elusimicrobiota bacterium]
MALNGMELTALWLLPALAAPLVWAAPSPKAARNLATFAAAAVLVYALWLIVPFSAQEGVLRLQELGAAGSYGIRYHVGVDGISLALCWLTAFLTLVSFVASWEGGQGSGYWAAFLALEAAVMGVFMMQDLFWFYVFWDAALIPMFFIIGLWGSSNRRKAALKFVLYTFVGGLSLLVGLIGIAVLHHGATGVWTWEVSDLAKSGITGPAAPWLF